ncbi:uncharacterized protein LOC135397517 [Ornithodoros turicata]|uniref:uncharacterized protein LOC135397517 n=1 Tax=Ornithodoros turicata TaxID=34597 RepID=UPI0031394797
MDANEHSKVQHPDERKCTQQKRPRVDDDDEIDNGNDSAPSIASDISSNENNMDDDGFITVVHKKNRKAGIPVILKPVNPEQSFLKANLNVVAKEVLQATQERIKKHRIATDGSLVITVATLPAAKALLALTSVASIAVTTRVPDSYARNIGKISGMRDQYTDEQLLEYFRPLGAIDVRRQRSYQETEDGDSQVQNSHTVIITFKSEIKMPEEIHLGFHTYQVEEYFTPTQCFKCLRFGHLARNCRGHTRCKYCAGPHQHKECTTKREKKCANCQGPHTATYGGCPKRKIAARSVKHNAYEEKVTRKEIRTMDAELVHIPETAPPDMSEENFPNLPRISNKPEIQKANTSGSQPHPAAKPKASVWETEDTKKRAKNPVRAPRRKRRTQLEQHNAEQQNTKQRSMQDKEAVASHDSRRDARQQITPFDGSTLVMQIIPFVIAALKAVVASLPNARDIPEVKQVLALEPELLRVLTATHHG